MTGRPGPALRAGRLPDAADAVAVLQRLDTLAGQDIELELLTGGLTNRNYRIVTRAGAQYVARFSSVKTSLLAIDREAEFHNSTIAARAGVGPAVAEFAPDEGVLLVEWIAGRTFAPADLDDEAQLTRLAGVCRRLHAAPRFASDFDMFAIQQRYLAIVRELGFRLPEDYLMFEPIVARVEKALRG